MQGSSVVAGPCCWGGMASVSGTQKTQTRLGRNGKCRVAMLDFGLSQRWERSSKRALSALIVRAVEIMRPQSRALGPPLVAGRCGQCLFPVSS